MLSYILRRILIAIPTLVVISIVNFIIFDLPPGDFATAQIASLEQDMAEGGGGGVEHYKEAIQQIRNRYGLDKPVYVRYWKWISGFVRGDLGEAFAYSRADANKGQEVNAIFRERLPYTLMLSLFSAFFVYIMAIPIALWVSTHQYKFSDYFFTFLGFIGLATPNFLLALIILWFYFLATGQALMGFFSNQFLNQPWSVAKVLDLLNHLWIPIIIVGTAGTAGTIRILRATMLDEMGTNYIKFERAKGLKRSRVIRHAFRVASNPIVAGLGSLLPGLIGGSLLTSIVLALPTLGPVFYDAAVSQDIYLAASYMMIVTILLVIGNLIADIILAWLDPRIRFD